MKKDGLDIKYLAQLAQIHLSSQEEKQLDKDLQNILHFIAIIRRVNTKEVEPTFQVAKDVQMSRPDQKEKSLPREAALQNAPQQKNGYFISKPIGWK